MVEIVGVGFVNSSKPYYFDPCGEQYKMGELVIVETARGKELGHILIENRMVDESELVAELKPIDRKACEDDINTYKENIKKRDEALRICAEKIAKHNLEMKLIDVEFMIDGSKIVFYFSADGRVDFRDLAKDLASHFKNRIELRQIGVRDETKMLGGIGICGRQLCCNQWMHDFQPVSIKMAKLQNLSLNPTKISGSCGRLMCCLKFEDSMYKELRRGMPNDNERVETPEGLAKVISVDYFNGNINTRLIEKDTDSGEDVLSDEIKVYGKEDIKRKSNKNRSKNEEHEAAEEDIIELQELMREF